MQICSQTKLWIRRGASGAAKLRTEGRLFFIAAAAFALGILLSSLYTLPWTYIGAAALATLIALLVWLKNHNPILLLVIVVFAAATLGSARVAISQTHLPPHFVAQLGTKVELSGVVVVAPDVRGTNQHIVIAVTDKGQHTRILATVSRSEHITYGASVTVRGTLKTPTSFAINTTRIFRYDHYLEAEGVFALMPHASVISVTPTTRILARAYGFLIGLKQTFLHALALALPEPSASLAGGIVAGGLQGLGTSLTNDFVRSGLIHIVVLSGYNVMIVADAVLFALSFLTRRVAAGAAAFTIGAFVLAAGAGAASIRAGLMAGFALAARATGRTYDVTRALVVAILLMLLWNPFILAFRMGFVLSVAATLGLIFGMPLVEPKLAFIKSTFVRETVAATLSAQIAVLPFLLWSNGIFSLVSIFANVLVLPFVPLTMAASAVAGIVGVVLPTVAPVAGLPAYALLRYIMWIVHTSASLPFAFFVLPNFSFVFVVIAYATLIFIFHRLMRNKKPAIAG